MTMGWDDGETMKPHRSLLARGGVVALLGAIVFVLSVFVFQCLYWLRFDSWFDWTDPNGPRFPGQSWAGGPWKGVQAIFDLIVTAPVQLFASITGLILVVLYVWVRRSGQR
jgi:hypothetical protein